MPTPKKGRRLGGSPAHQRRMLRNLATALFEHGRVTTTETRARMLRPYAEKLITKAKKGDLHNRRLVMRELYTSVDWALFEESGEVAVNKFPQHRLFTEIAPSFVDRPGGYTRITKLGPRKGDNAPMAVIELVTEAYTPSTSTASRSTAGSTAAPVVEEPAEAPVAEESTEGAVADDAVEAKAEEAGIATFAATPEADADAAAETEGGVAGKYAGSHVPLEDETEAPEGFPVKGNEDSMKYHEPDGQWYEQTVAEIWFDSAASAEAAGFTKAGS